MTTLTLQTPVEHPTWCDHTRCTVLCDLPLDGSMHLSRTVHIDTALTFNGPLTAVVWLCQEATDDTAYVVVDIPATRGRAAVPLACAKPGLLQLLDLIDPSATTTT